MIQNPADPPSRPCIAPQVLEELAREYGTPLYILNLDIVDQQWSKLSAFDSIRYAQKAHSGLHLLKWLAKKNAHVDAVSGTEVLKAIHAGFPVEH
ncbi:MAG: diaminopimelate decarboxylase, partial [Planctomycetota bacterium]